MAKAYVYTRHGGPEVEAFTDEPPPRPGEGHLLIAVRAAGVNPVDFKQREGYRRPGADPAVLPAVFGSEAAGTVEAVGAGAEGFAVGDAVFGGPLTGGYAEYTLLPVTFAAHKPEGVSFAQAATLPVAAATAFDGLRQLGLPAGATLLVTGAGGGVGEAVVQLARAQGLRVVGVASAAKADFVSSLGATHVPSGPGLVARVRAALSDGSGKRGPAGGDGVDGAFDTVGGEVVEEAAELVADRTGLVSVGGKDRVAALGGSAVVRERSSAVLDQVVRLVADGSLTPHITRTFPLGQASEALRAVEEGHSRGKTVIEVRP